MKPTKEKEWNKGNLQIMQISFDNEKQGGAKKKYREYIVLNNTGLSTSRKNIVINKRNLEYAGKDK